MKSSLLVLLVSIPFSAAFAAGDDVCKNLTDIVKHHEETLQQSWITSVDEQGIKQECRVDSAEKQIVEKHPHLAAEGSQNKLLKDLACASLATIETRIAQLENEQSLLTGFHKLKSDIKANQEKTEDPNPAKAKFAGGKFIVGVNAAKTLEQLLANNGNMLKAIKGDESLKVLIDPSKGLDSAKRYDAGKIKTYVKDTCSKNNDTSGICAKDAFQPNQDAVNAINDLINNSDLKDEQINSWTKALSIKTSDGKTWSFADIQKELKEKMGDIESGKLSLTRTQLKAIQTLDKFQDAGGLEFSEMKKDIKIFSLLQEYSFHVQDLKQRQGLEIQSKAVLALSLVKKETAAFESLSAENKGICEASRSAADKAILCLKALSGLDQKLTADIRSKIQELNTATEVSAAYMNDLDEKHSKCLGITVTTEFKQKAELPQECIDALKDVDARQAEITSSLQVLNALKDKIGEQNQDVMKVRNLALSNIMSTPNCGNSVQHSTVQCSFENLNISPSVDILSSNVANVMAIQREKPNLENKWLCDNAGLKIFGKDVLCDLNKPKPKPVVAKLIPEVEYNAPLNAPSSGKSAVADANWNGIGQLGGMIAGSLFAPKPQFNYYPPYNPYLYNYSSYNPGYPIMGISDQLLFNARYQGAYGYYMPTQGLQPYTAFGGGISSYRPYPTTKSPYFSR